MGHGFPALCEPDDSTIAIEVSCLIPSYHAPSSDGSTSMDDRSQRCGIRRAAHLHGLRKWGSSRHSHYCVAYGIGAALRASWAVSRGFCATTLPTVVHLLGYSAGLRGASSVADVAGKGTDRVAHCGVRAQPARGSSPTRRTRGRRSRLGVDGDDQGGFTPVHASR
jgi:hypothetical protein